MENLTEVQKQIIAREAGRMKFAAIALKANCLLEEVREYASIVFAQRKAEQDALWEKSKAEMAKEAAAQREDFFKKYPTIDAVHAALEAAPGGVGIYWLSEDRYAAGELLHDIALITSGEGPAYLYEASEHRHPHTCTAEDVYMLSQKPLSTDELEALCIRIYRSRYEHQFGAIAADAKAVRAL